MRKLFKALLTSLAVYGLMTSPCSAFEGSSHVNAPEKASAATTTPIWAINGTACYLDLGEISSELWGFMEWWPVTQLNMTKYDQYLTSMFSQLKAAGVNQIDLAFTQISSIDALLNNGQGGSQYDVIAQMMISFPGALQELIREAHAFGFRVDLAFGGENGTEMQICGPGETPQGQAQKLVQFMQMYNIDAVDFDIESTLFTSANSAPVAQAFFRTLKQMLQMQNKTSTLTIEGSLQDWPLNFLKELFYDANNQLIFPQLFSSLNLMLYSETQYYIDASNPTWGIEQWIDLLGTQNAGMITIGFEDAVNYASPSASAGGKYVFDTTNPGIAAAEIYMQLLQALAAAGYPTNLGEPFFWPDNNRHASGTWSRYQAINKNGQVTVKFAADVMSAFYQKLKSP